MKLIFVTEARFIKDTKGNFYGESSFNYLLWQRYLTSFSEVIIMARVSYEYSELSISSHLSSGYKVSFIELPHFKGPVQYLKNRKDVIAKVKEGIKENDGVFICRVPGTIGNTAINYLYKNKIPFGVEVVGDPWDVFAPGSIKHIFRAYFRWSGYFNLKKNVSLASAVLYVTKNKLQERYPSDINSFQIAASNVNIKNVLIKNKPHKHKIKQEYKIISVGSLEQMYKAPDIVLKAIKLLNNQGFCCRLIWLGDGKYKSKMIALAKELGIFDFIDFKGNVSEEEVREFLAAADLFVLASRTEGLPRAIIEAMSFGLPCIGTNVGGIPELLDEEVLIQKDSVQALTEKVIHLLENPKLYNIQAARNLLEASKYKQSILHTKRKRFYDYLINLK